MLSHMILARGATRPSPTRHHAVPRFEDEVRLNRLREAHTEAVAQRRRERFSVATHPAG